VNAKIAESASGTSVDPSRHGPAFPPRRRVPVLPLSNVVAELMAS
jgi:hypothetical protein